MDQGLVKSRRRNAQDLAQVVFNPVNHQHGPAGLGNDTRHDAVADALGPTEEADGLADERVGKVIGDNLGRHPVKLTPRG